VRRVVDEVLGRHGLPFSLFLPLAFPRDDVLFGD